MHSMGDERPYKVLIVEDEVRCIAQLRDCFDKHEKYTVLSVTGSSHEALKLIKIGLPDIVIVDLHLKEGSGFALLERLRNPNEHIPLMPYILGSTKFTADSTWETLGQLADFAFAKADGLCNTTLILEHLRIVEKQFARNRNAEPKPIDLTLEKEDIIRTRIESELDQYFMPRTTKGRKYLERMLYKVFTLPKHTELNLTRMYNEIGQEFRNNPDNVDMAIRRVLKTAFTKTDTSDLERLFTPYIDPAQGWPGTKEFVVNTVAKFQKERIIPHE